MSAWSTSANLGDVLWHLHFLMTMGGEHQVFIKPEYILQLEELAQGYPITFHPVDQRPSNSMDMWIANGMHESRGVHFYNQVDIIGFLQEWFNHYGGFCGMPKPVYETRPDMLWACPSIPNANVRSIPVDVLMINSSPTSGQCPGYSQEEVDGLGSRLRENGLYVLFAKWEGECPYSITELAKLSIQAKLIIASANGPHWSTWNVWNQDTERLIFLDPMKLDYHTSGHTNHVANAQQAYDYLKNNGWL